jgi:hypothetical protein
MKLIAHINCSPYVEDGTWNIHVNGHDYYHTMYEDADERFFDILDDYLSKALDNHGIHSYYLERDDQPNPVVHDVA